MRLYKIVKKPIVTEKSSKLELKENTYMVEVAKDATKIDIKKAFKDIYGVDVESVRTINTITKYTWALAKHSKVKRRATKKAYIKLRAWEKQLDFIDIK